MRLAGRPGALHWTPTRALGGAATRTPLPQRGPQYEKRGQPPRAATAPPTNAAAPTDRLDRLGLYGALSGTLSKLAVYPFDLAKKRLQMQGVPVSEALAANGVGRLPAYSGLAHCLLTVFRAEGAPGLFRGILPGLLKAAPATSASFVTFEAAQTVLRDRLGSSRRSSSS